MVISRRSALAGGVSLLAAPFINRGRFRLFGAQGPEYSTSVVDLVRESTVIDMLGLLTLDYRRLCAWQTNGLPFPLEEFQRLREAGITAIHPGVGFVQGDIYAQSRADLERWNAFLAAHPDLFVRVDTARDIDRAKASGKIGVIFGLQNSSHFRTMADVDAFYELGQRISQLTYYDNPLGGGSTSPRRGLTSYGARIVERMNRIGMAIDVSHCADQTTLDAIDASRKPVLVTHSNCRALVPSSPRCKTDEAVRRLGETGGVLGVTMVRYFVRTPGPATIEDLLDHIDHVAHLAGIEHVGLGTDVDLDGRDGIGIRKHDLDGADYSRKIYDVTEGLLRRGYSPQSVRLVLGGNFKRVLAEIQTV